MPLFLNTLLARRHFRSLQLPKCGSIPMLVHPAGRLVKNEIWPWGYISGGLPYCCYMCPNDGTQVVEEWPESSRARDERCEGNDSLQDNEPTEQFILVQDSDFIDSYIWMAPENTCCITEGAGEDGLCTDANSKVRVISPLYIGECNRC